MIHTCGAESLHSIGMYTR